MTDDPTGDMHFHEWDLTPEEASSLRDLNRYAQVWSESGESLVRSRYLTLDLPLDSAALQDALGGELVWVEGVFESDHVRSLYYPLGRLGPSHLPHVLQVAAPLTARDRTLGLVGRFLAGVIVLVTGGTFVGGWWLGSRTIRPVHEVIDQSEEIGAGTLGRRIGVHADTQEYERLVRVLNTMLDRIDAAFDAQRRFTADASHELRSPVTALRGELELALRRERSPQEYRRVIASALEETERLSDLAADLLTLARSDAGAIEPRLVPVDVRERLSNTLERIRAKADAKQIRLGLTADGEVRAACDPDLLDRVAWNLLDNAIKFTTPGGRVEASVSAVDADVVIEVADTGPGVPEHQREEIFRRFYRGNAPHGPQAGTGLGLAIVRAIADAHGGSVTVENRDTGGALFSVRLPTNT